jgi:hypothetical protein
MYNHVGYWHTIFSWAAGSGIHQTPCHSPTETLESPPLVPARHATKSSVSLKRDLFLTSPFCQSDISC